MVPGKREAMAAVLIVDDRRSFRIHVGHLSAKQRLSGRV
jgi:hypothetical protein